MCRSLTSRLRAAAESSKSMSDDINEPHMLISISAAIISSWRQRWCNLSHYKQLRSILDIPDGFALSIGTRKFDIVLNRLISDHSLLTHAYLLLKTPPPTCTTCLVPLTIPHILLECPISATLRSPSQPRSLQTLHIYPSSYLDFFPPRLLNSIQPLSSFLFPQLRLSPRS